MFYKQINHAGLRGKICLIPLLLPDSLTGLIFLMIISKIIGGLGNQLFQYAAGRCLAWQHQTDLALDISGFDEYKLRNFDLGAFGARYRFSTKDENSVYEQRGFIGKVRDRLLPMGLRKVYREPHFHFHSRFFKSPSHIYLKGYWQSEKYFSPVAEQIREELVMKPAYYKEVQTFATTIQQTPAVSVHIRRGDYTNPEVLRAHGMLSPEYYIRAMQLIREKEPGAVFYFFSDDIQWVKENLPVENVVYVSGIHSRTHFEDFWLMSRCRHHIIANSSFSWWAAWLNNFSRKMVIAPEKWFNEKKADTRDLIPNGWIKL